MQHGASQPEFHRSGEREVKEENGGEKGKRDMELGDTGGQHCSPSVHVLTFQE